MAGCVVADELDLEQGGLGQVEGGAVLDAQQTLQMIVSCGLGHVRERPLVQDECGLGQHLLARLAVNFDEARTQHPCRSTSAENAWRRAGTFSSPLNRKARVRL